MTAQRRTILTPQEFLEMERALEEHFVRQLHEETTAGQSLDRWLVTAYQGLGNVVTLASLGIELPLSEIYDKVDWAEGEGGARTLRVVREQGDSYEAEQR